MSTETWPLSAAATQLLIDLRTDGPGNTASQTISRLAVKELVVRGQLRILAVRKRRLRSTVVTVANNPHAVSRELPPPLYLLATSLPATDGDDLSKVIRKAAKAFPKLFSSELKASALEELTQSGLTEERYRKVLGFWPSSYQAPTPLGEQWAARARSDAAHVESLRPLLDADPNTAYSAARSLGALLLLAPSGLAIAVALASKWRDGLGQGLDAAVGAGGFDVLESLGDSLGDLLSTIGDLDFGGLDSAFDAIGSAVDSGIDSGVSDGGGDGGGGDGGSGCGGGGCGGGCGGS